jgi:hypothetical protein
MVTLSGSRADLAARPATAEPYVQVSPHGLKHRPARSRSTAGGVPDGARGGREHGSSRGGGVAARDDLGVADLLEVRVEDRFAGRAPAPPVYLGESGIAH